jgi:hypothetical protein
MLEGTLKTIAVSMANCEFYASIFKEALNRQFESPETSMAWEKQLERALPEFYASILVFSVKAKGYFIPSTACKISPCFLSRASILTVVSQRESINL